MTAVCSAGSTARKATDGSLHSPSERVQKGGSLCTSDLGPHFTGEVATASQAPFPGHTTLSLSAGCYSWLLVCNSHQTLLIFVPSDTFPPAPSFRVEMRSAPYICAQRKWGPVYARRPYFVTGPVAGMHEPVPRDLNLPCLEEQLAAFPNMRISATSLLFCLAMDLDV